jgi:hypothetical protein
MTNDKSKDDPQADDAPLPDTQVKESGNAEPSAKPGQFDIAVFDAAVWGD